MKSETHVHTHKERVIKIHFDHEVQCTLVTIARRDWFGKVPVSWQVPSSSKIMTHLSNEGVCIQCMYKVNFHSKYRLNPSHI